MKNKLIIIVLFSIIQIFSTSCSDKNHLILFLAMVLLAHFQLAMPQTE
jgi:hypothetical protein